MVRCRCEGRTACGDVLNVQRLVSNLARAGKMDEANKLNEANRNNHKQRAMVILRNARH